MISEKYNLIVIGAGSAGCLAAFTAKTKGLNKVLLIDRKKKIQIGSKICGDGIGTKHLKFLEKLGFPIKENNVTQNRINRAHIVSPDKKVVSKLNVFGTLSIINRHNFGQTLLQTTIDSGVKLYDCTTLSEIKRKENEIILEVKTKEKKYTLAAPLIIDASGVNSKIREASGIFDEYAKLTDDQQYYCYREIIHAKKLPQKYKNNAIFEFSFGKTKGGYMWYFNRGNNELNMGTGIPKKWIKQISPKTIYQEEMIKNFKNYQVLDNGGGFVPTRQPMPTHVKDNIILAGDAGTIVNPIHGGGLSPSVHSGYYAGNLAAELIPNETVKEDDLWRYNKQIVERYTHRYAILDLYRILLQNIYDEELLQALKNDYLPLGKIFYARRYSKLIKLSRKLGETWSELDNPRFNLLPNYIEKIHELTSSYPKTPYELKTWSKDYLQVYSDYQKQVKIKV